MSGDSSLSGDTLLLSTPEHVAVPFRIAPIGSRVSAFMIDSLVLFAGLVGIAIVFGIASSGDSSGFLQAFVLLALFIGRNFYFSFSEIRLQGQTFGKRRARIRVIARDGGPLTADMVFARNLTRDLEFFLPLTVLFAPNLLFGDEPVWARVVSLLWLGVIVLLPFFNRHRARVGDLIAGTVVVLTPEGHLLDDLSEERGTRAGQQPSFTFTQQQLDVYGIHELQVLEDVLRQSYPDPEVLATIAEKIKRKIQWSKKLWNVPPEPFLRTFYAAQRGRLEHKMLLGKRQERKIG